MKTAIWVCALRAEEQEHSNPLFYDPFSSILCKDEKVDILRLMDERRKDPSKKKIPYAVVRTRYFDDYIKENLIKQVVFIGGGLDTRPWRIDWQENSTLFDVDRLEVHNYKSSKLDAVPKKCQYKKVIHDLNTLKLEESLIDSGFDTTLPTLWVFEGVSMYLPEKVFNATTSTINQLSASGSSIVMDVFNKEILTNPSTKKLMSGLQSDGSPVIFGVSSCSNILPDSWQIQVIQPGEDNANYGRWPVPVPPANQQNAPRAYFISGKKQ